jgi:integrase
MIEVNWEGNDAGALSQRHVKRPDTGGHNKTPKANLSSIYLEMRHSCLLLSGHGVTLVDGQFRYPTKQLGNTMAKVLTAKSIANLKPGTSRREVPDGGCRGLYYVIHPSGRTSWAVRYRFQGKPRKLTLDGLASLAEARRAATAAMLDVERGEDPSAAKAVAKAAAQQAQAGREADTIENVVDLFVERHAKRHTRASSVAMATYVYQKLVIPVWGGRSVHDIKRRDVIDLVESVADDRPVLANRLLAHLTNLFGWLCARDIIVASPATGVSRPTKEVARDRILTDIEIKQLLENLEDERETAFIQLLLLTGQRRREVSGMRWSEIDGDTWNLPPERVKNGQRHSVPLSRQTLAIVRSMPETSACVFGGTRGLADFSHLKTRLNARVKLSERWTLHDLRRTTASGMAKIGIKLPVIERVLNHTSGSFAGIVGVYQRHDFAAEKRAALQQWADYVDQLVSGAPTDKVVRGRFVRT